MPLAVFIINYVVFPLLSVVENCQWHNHPLFFSQVKHRREGRDAEDAIQLTKALSRNEILLSLFKNLFLKVL